MAKRMIVEVGRRELALLADAFDTYLVDQLPSLQDRRPRAAGVTGDKRRLAVLAQRIAEAHPGPLSLTAVEACRCAEALEAHLYWERDDRDPVYVEACREVDVLRARFENGSCPEERK